MILHKQFMITLLGIIIFSAWQLNSKEDDAETDRRKRATREAISREAPWTVSAFFVVASISSRDISKLLPIVIDHFRR